MSRFLVSILQIQHPLQCRIQIFLQVDHIVLSPVSGYEVFLCLWSTLPSECRQRKDPYLALWGGKGGETSRVQGLPWGQDMALPFPRARHRDRRPSVPVGTGCIENLVLKTRQGNHINWGIDTRIEALRGGSGKIAKASYFSLSEAF